MYETLSELQRRLLVNLDDTKQTAFNPELQKSLLNEALRWLLNLATMHNYFYRQEELSLSIAAGTSSYALETSTGQDLFARHIIMIEREDSDSRAKGTLVRKSQRNNVRHKKPPVMFQNFQQNSTGQWRKHLIFASKDQPTDSYTLTVTYAPIMTRLIGADDFVVDIDQDFMDLLVLRATIQGFGGEKNVDQFWGSQFNASLGSSLEMMENTSKDEPEYVNEVQDFFIRNRDWSIGA